MEKTPIRFPFATSFQLRSDERSGLEALFERTFFDRPFSPEARQSLLRTCYQRSGKTEEGTAAPAEEPSGAGPGKGPGEKAPAASRPASASALVAPFTPVSCPYPGEGARHVLLYRGANGIGKTRIFRQFRESASRKHIPVYEVYHHDVEGIPFKPFLLAIREILRDHDRGAALEDKYRYGLKSIFPELERPVLAEPGAPPERGDEGPEDRQKAPDGLPWVDEADKVRIFDAITQLLLEVTAQKPLIILVHDLHWSDHPTIELLGYIGRNLQIRCSQPAVPPGPPLVPENVLGEPGAGPEMDDLENEEWRTLPRSSPQGLELLGLHYYAFPPLSGLPSQAPRADALAALAPALPPAAPPLGRDDSARDGDAGLSAAGQPSRAQEGPRLMILANYRGFADPTHYLEQSLRALGSQQFAYHGELCPLSRAESGPFIQKCLEGVEADGRPIEMSSDATDAIHEASEGFPSFTQELFRGMHLREGGFAAGGDPFLWPGARIAEALDLPAPPTGTTDGPNDGESQPLGRRHAILRLRLSSATPPERRVLQAMALARRPVSRTLIARVLSGFPEIDPAASAGTEGEGNGAGLEAGVARALEALEERGIVERQEVSSAVSTLSASLGKDDAFHSFRLWDYASVVEETVLPEEQKRLHQRIGEECLSRFGGESDEAAYEVFYHLHRGVEPRKSVEYGLLAARRFVRSFALEKARRVHNALIDILSAPEDLPRRIDLLERTARSSLALKNSVGAEEILRRAQTEGAQILSPERRVELILAEAEAASLTDPDRGLKILGKAPKLLKDENNRLGVRLQLLTARLRLERQDIKRAINFSLKGISICQKLGDLPELGELYRVMASAFYRKGDYAHAVDNYQRALDAFEKLELTEASVGALDELGRVYLERGNYFRAARYLYKSVEIRRRHHDLPGLCRSYDELGRVYLRSGDYLKTIDNLNRSLALRERIGDFPGLNPTLVILGDLYFRLGRYEQALVYFRREVENSQKIGDTRGLVEAFAQLGRVFLELGDLKQAESLSKQVSILATEFKLRSQEADGALIDGSLKALARDWAGAEKCFKLAAETHGKLGHRRREVSAYLEIAEVKFSRELFDESLKFASKGQIIAEEVKALDLQVRALTIKGSIHRFLKGGNPEKAREFLYRALELSHGLSDVSALFHLYYSLAKVCHSQREFAEAANYYSKAELILKQVRDALSEDRGGRFFEDRRRKVFGEDVARFRKEALGRASGAAVDLREPQAPATGAKDRPVGFADYKDLMGRILRTHSDLNHLHFHERILAEVVELTGADRGFLIRVQNRKYFPTAFHGFGKSPTQHPDFAAASALAEEAVRRGRSVLASGFPGGGDGKGKKEERELPLGSLSQRSVLAVPFMTDERIFGGVYLDKPVVLGQFVPRNQVLLEAFAQHTAVALSNRREFETAIREPLTGFYTPGYFIDRLREAYRWFNLHGRSFTLIGCYLPSLEDMLGEGLGDLAKSLAHEIEEVLPHSAATSWGSPILYVLLSEADLAVQEDVAGRIRARLQATLGEDVPMEVIPATNRHQNGSEVYFEVRRRLVPETCDRKTLVELRSLLAHDITLREAKKILERHKIESTLRKTGGNMTHAARELGIHRPQLSNLLKKHELKREVFEGDLNGATELGPSRSDPSEN